MADEITGGTTDIGGGTADSGAAAASQPLTITESSQFIPPGSDKPTTWKDFQSGYVSKADLTRMRQEDTARLQQERAAWEQTRRQQIEQEIQQRYAQQQQGQQGQRQATEWLQELRKQPYLSGEQAATLVEQTMIPLHTQMRQLANALTLMHQRYEQVQQSVGSISGKYAQGELSNLMQTTKTKLNLPNEPIIDDLLQDVYHSYQGWESDPAAFEQMVSDRWRNLQATIRALDKQRADDARRQTAPAKPGIARPGKPLATGGESPEALADRLWSGMQSVNT